MTLNVVCVQRRQQNANGNTDLKVCGYEMDEDREVKVKRRGKKVILHSNTM